RLVRLRQLLAAGGLCPGRVFRSPAGCAGRRENDGRTAGSEGVEATGMSMKIVMINSLYTPHIVGGAEISTQILAESLASYAEVHVLTTGGQPRNDGVRTEEINGVLVHRLPHANLYWIGDARKRGVLKRSARRLIDQHNPAQIRAVRDLVGSLAPDVVHTHNLSGFGASVWKACADQEVPVVHTLRDY